jgi:hypothetical protein
MGKDFTKEENQMIHKHTKGSGNKNNAKEKPQRRPQN